MSRYLRHPLSTAFGEMSEEEFAGLKASVAELGVREAIVLLDDQVLDGWHRFRAATECGVACPHRNFPPDEDPKAFVIAKNRWRRNQTPSQLAIAVATVTQWKAPFRPGAQKAAPGSAFSKSTEEMAEIAGVSDRTMRQAKAVVRNAAPEVKEAVKEGAVSVKRAAEVSTLPRNEQVVALIDPQSAPAVALAAKAPRPKKPKAPVDDTAGTDDMIALHSRIADLEFKLKEVIEKNYAGAKMLEDMHAELQSANAVIDASDGADRIKAALVEARRYREAHRQLEERLRGAMEEKNAAIREAKAWQRRANGNGATRAH